MKNLDVNVGGKKIKLNLPESISEVNFDYLEAVTKEVVVEQNYALVALCVSDKLSVLINSKQREVNVKGISILVKANDPNNTLKSKPGDKLICSPTDLMRGYEVTAIRNILSPSKVAMLVKSDIELSKTIFTTNTESVWLVTFKLVPLHDIHGSYTTSELTDEDKKAINYYCE